jgi:hypothetical protein
MALHFFINPNTLPDQGSNDSYGVIDDTRFRVSSVFNLSGQSMAYAVTSGVVFVQLQQDPGKVNLVLKPHGQINGHGIPKVEYFVYRGLDASDFYNNQTGFLTDKGVSDYIDRVWADFEKAKEQGLVDGTVPHKNRTGFEWNDAEGPTFLDYAMKMGDPFGFSPINAGETLGRFAIGKIGFDVILQDKRAITLRDVRKEENIIEAATPSGIPGNLLIEQMREREAILNYVDPCAFFLATPSGEKILSNGGPIENFYNEVAAKFQTTKDKIYLDIRNENDYSLNYYKDQGVNPAGEIDGFHFSFGFGGSSTVPSNYYENYWPLMVFETSSQKLSIRFRTRYNPEGVVYADRALSIEQNWIEGSKKFQFDKSLENAGANPQPEWSDAFSYGIPPVGGMYMRLYICRMKVVDTPDLPLPSTAFKRSNFLDNVFGPLNFNYSYHDLPASTQWFADLGKRFINARDELGFVCMTEVVAGFSDSSVLFQAKIIAKDRGIPEDTVPATSAATGGTEILEAQSLYTNQPPTIARKYGGYYIVDNQLEDFFFIMTNEEYYDKIYPAAQNFNIALHDLFVNLTFQGDYEIPGVEGAPSISIHIVYANISGFDSDGNYQSIAPVGGQIGCNTLNKRHFCTNEIGEEIYNNKIESSGIQFSDAYLDIDTFIACIQAVEGIYSDTLSLATQNIGPDSLLDTATRIRVHYYGKFASFLLDPIGQGKGIALNNAILWANTEKSYDDTEMGANGEPFSVVKKEFLQLRKSQMESVPNGSKYYTHLTSQADENGIKDNPGPILILDSLFVTGAKEQMDIGHLLYGFEASVRVPDELHPFQHLNDINNVASQQPEGHWVGVHYRGYNIQHPFDFAGILGDLGISAGDYFFHLVTGKKPDEPYYPANPDIDRYYETSSPDADLLGDVDAVCLNVAYRKTEPKNELKLSQLVEFYYKEIPLPPSFSINSTNLPDYISKYHSVFHRWLIFSQYLGFLKQLGGPSSDSYVWLPSLPNNDPEWAPIRDNWLLRMRNFMEFWGGRRKGSLRVFIWNTISNQNVDLPPAAVYRFENWPEYSSHPNFLQNINNIAEQIFIERFLQFIKSKLQSEIENDPQIVINFN